MMMQEYIAKLEVGLRALREQEREAQERAAELRDACLRQEGALLALRELMAADAVTPDPVKQENGNGPIH